MLANNKLQDLANGPLSDYLTTVDQDRFTIMQNLEDMAPEAAQFLVDVIEGLQEESATMLPDGGIFIDVDDSLKDFYERLVQQRIENPEHPETTPEEVFFYLLSVLRANV